MFGMGIDLCEIKRFDRLKTNEHFLERVFTKVEIDYCLKRKSSSQCLAVRFAAKEAFAKAMGTGFTNGIHFDEIEIVNNDLGKPDIRLYGSTKERFDKLDLKKINISLSHEKNYAAAVVIVE
ncbi:MAG TPA: holo-ACP synthase [Spirochaetota bacterium]|nr:holo-ACP synthase [Spirochaetota bacterium]